ncbi:UbiA family prenyltransferase [bacterium]|nr:UbiA family prenyltransferase [bacterium]
MSKLETDEMRKSMSGKMADKFRGFVEKFENSSFSFNSLLLFVLCAIFLRNFLETFSDLGNLWTPISSLAFFVHFPLGYICAAMALIIVLHYFTKERVERVSKLILLFFPIILLAPILDLIISGGKGYNMSYFFGDFKYLLSRFTVYFGQYSGSGVTPGIHIEMSIIFILLIFYLYTKTGKWLKTALGIISLYLVVFLFAGLPSLVTIFWNIIGFAMEPDRILAGDVVLNHFYSFNQKMGLLFFPILLVELGIWIYCYDNDKFLELVKKTKSLMSIHFMIMLASGMLIGYYMAKPLPFFETPFPILIVLTACCSILFAWLWFDRNRSENVHEYNSAIKPGQSTDAVSFNLNERKAFNLVLLILALMVAFLVRYPFFIPVLLFLSIAYLYSATPVRLKRIPLLGSFSLAACSLLVCLAGFAIFSKDYSYMGFPPKLIFAILILYTFVFNIKEIIHPGTDSINGKKTLVSFLGPKKGRIIVSFLTISSFLAIALLLKSVLILIFAVILGSVVFFLINRKKPTELPIFIVYTIFYCIIFFSVYIKL